MLIAIEGMDGSGKTSVAQAVADELQAVLIEFPKRTGTVTGPLIDEYLKNGWWVARPMMCAGERVRSESLRDEKGSALSFQALMATNRLECMPAIKSALAAGVHVVCSRYWQSGWVYGQVDGLGREFLRLIHLSMIHADVNVLLDISAEEGIKRRSIRDGKDTPPERYEAKVGTMKKANGLYRELWRDTSLRQGFQGVWACIDASQDFEEVVRQVEALIPRVRF